MAPSRIVLHQFPSSHFNEKARWALDWKRVPHRRKSYLPGPHAAAIRRLSGQTATPVLEVDGRCVAGSAAILARLEQLFPERPLHPVEPAERERALAIQRDFDREVGPAVRTAAFSVLIGEPGFLAATFAGVHPAPVRWGYRAMLPLVSGRIARAHETDDDAAVARAFAASERTLDFVAKHGGREGPLVGDAFGIADLTCAALLAPLVEVDHPDMRRPAPVPDAVRDFLDRWSAHPGAEWVRAQYARHRPLPHPPEDPCPPI